MGLGMLLHQLQIGVAALLLARLVVKGYYREYPVFVAYLAADVLESLLLFPLAYVGNWETYSAVYWAARPIMAGLMLAVCAELVAKAYQVDRRLELVAVFPAVILFAMPSVQLDQILRWGTCALLALVLPKIAAMKPVDVSLATGLFVMSVFPALLQITAMQGRANLVQYSSTVAFLLALGIWMQAFRCEAAQLHPPVG